MLKFRPDWFIVAPAILLLIISLTILRSIAPQLLASQFFFILLAALFYIFFSVLDYEWVFSLNFISYVGLLALSLFTAFFGVLSRGSQRWLLIGQFTLQPSELLKPFLLITFSYIVVSQIRKKNLILILAGLIPTAIVYLQPDLGTSLVILVGWLTIFFSRLSFKSVVILFFAFFIITIPLYKFVLQDYQKQRIQTFVDPYKDPLGKGYHVIQSTIAIGSGGLFGRGLGRGTQTQLKFLPEHHTDFIFASISEELGLVGSLTVILLYGIMFWRIYHISQISTDPKASLFCLASIALLGFQTFINIAMNLGIAPITGITLPLLSAGGSSLLSVGINLGIINSVSSSFKNNERIANKP